MVELREVASDVYWLEPPISDAPNFFSVYLIRGTMSAVVEPGPAATIPTVREALKHLGISDLAYLMPTHIHVDHAGGVGRMAQLFPDARVVVHPRGAKHLVDPSQLIESTKSVWGDRYEERFGPLLPVPESRLRITEDGESIDLGSRQVQVVYAPGHAPHHMAYFDSASGGLFCGEAVGLPGRGREPIPLPAVAPPSFDQQVYLETMEKLRALRPRKLFFSHGGVGEDPDRIIAIAEENTRVLGDLILRSLRVGESGDITGARVRDYAASRFGIELDSTDLAMTVGGYTLYFTRSGLV
jgi:glyoxylase-like metal-dependent hydrolase (beta-lactamase superfamily II)